MKIPSRSCTAQSACACLRIRSLSSVVTPTVDSVYSTIPGLSWLVPSVGLPSHSTLNTLSSVAEHPPQDHTIANIVEYVKDQQAATRK